MYACVNVPTYVSVEGNVCLLMHGGHEMTPSSLTVFLRADFPPEQGAYIFSPTLEASKTWPCSCLCPRAKGISHIPNCMCVVRT